MSIQIKDNSKIVFIGDSITDCGRRELGNGPLGKGYVKQFADLMNVRYPELKLDIINRGIGGDTIIGLRSRWDDDVITQVPDLLFVKIGINDLHIHLNNKEFAFLTLKEFKNIYSKLLNATVEKFPNCKIVLISPFYISNASREDSDRKAILDLIPSYINAVKELSNELNCDFINLQKLFHHQLKFQHPDIYCIEPVHPNSTGHLLIAEAIVNQLNN